MTPAHIGKQYDKIAAWWHRQHQASEYGVAHVEKAIAFSKKTGDAQGTTDGRVGGVGDALDVGCGAGGRHIRLLQQHGFAITGIDVSEQMIKIARAQHPAATFLVEDISRYTPSPTQRYDLIVAWDSVFHLPLALQRPVLTKLCALLSSGGVLLYTFGDAVGEHTDHWHGERFYYSSLGVNANLAILAENGVTCKHLELDQFPQSHVCVIGVKA